MCEKSEVELISEGIRKPSQENLASLQDEINHFTRLINDMFELSLTDINALNYQKDHFDICDVLLKTVDQFEPLFIDKNIQIHIMNTDDEMRFYGDSQRIRQVITNILKNSCNYTDHGGQIRINSNREAEHFVVEFSDSAPGLSDEAIEKVFQRFFRGENSRNRTTGGAGLGMAICESIMTEHKGKISANHSDLGGISVRLYFPINVDY